MKISWHYLNQMIDLSNMNIIDITEKLTLAGLEVENTEYEEANNDTIIDIYLTTNRQDIQGLINIATELSAILNKPTIINNNYIERETTNYIYIINNILNNGQVNKISPYLCSLNIPVSQTILDPINFINNKWSQGFKAYEITLETKTKLIQLSKEFKYLKKKDKGIDRKLLKELKVITNTKKNILDVLILNTKESNKFSSYAYQNLFQILDLRAEQILELSILTHNKNKNVQTEPIVLNSIEQINKILGPTQKNENSSALQKKDIINYLKRLDFYLEDINNQLKIVIPNERQIDIKNEIDIIEEVGRIHGFNNFIDNLPRFSNNYLDNPTSKLIQKIRQILRFNGLHEVISPSFQEKKGRVQCKIVNPLNQEQNLLRDNLIENLVTLKKNNIYNKNGPFEIFEIGTVFIKNKQNKKYKESKHLCCLIGEDSFNQSNWQTHPDPLTWSQGKGQIEDLFEKLNAQVLWSTKKKENMFTNNIAEYIHPKRTIYIHHKDKTIGVFSQLNYRINRALNLNYNMFFCEIDILSLLDTIVEKEHLNYRYLHYTHYPKTTRDLSIKVKKSIPMEKIQERIFEIEQNTIYMIESIKILNEYCNIDKSRTICFRIDYRSSTKTLTNTEVDILENNLKQKFDKILKSKA